MIICRTTGHAPNKAEARLVTRAPDFYFTLLYEHTFVERTQGVIGLSQGFRRELQELTESELYQRIVGDPDVIEEILHAYGIRMTAAPLGLDAEGMVVRYKARWYIIGNQMLEYEEQRRVFIHELYHIISEGKNQKLVRLDYDEEEYAADMVAAEVAAGWGQGNGTPDAWS